MKAHSGRNALVFMLDIVYISYTLKKVEKICMKLTQGNLLTNFAI